MENIYYCNVNVLDYNIYLASTDKGLISLSIEDIEENFISQLKKSFKGSNLTYDSDKNILCIEQLKEYCEGNRKEFDMPLHLIGTDFQKKVWKALCEIPYGKVVSYKDIATKIGNPKAVRAVGMANNRNKIAIIIPCHRVIGSNRDLVGYGGGLHIKEKLLKLEGLQISDKKVVVE